MKLRITAKALRATFFGLVCFITLAALVIAEENLRAKLAWQKVKNDLEAKGEHLDMAWFIPPPVPEDQNLAEIPLFKPLNTVMETGNYPPALDQWIEKLREYAGQSSKLALSHFRGKANGSWQTGDARDLRMWQEYYRAVLHQIGLSKSPEEDVVTATNNLKGTFADLREGIRTRRYCRFDIQYHKGPGASLPHLAPLEYLVKILSVRATAELRLNRPGDAFDDVQLAFHLIEATRSEPFLISGLVHIAQISVLIGPIWEGIATHRWDDAQLGAFQTELRSLDFLSDYCRAIRMERSMAYGMMTLVLQDPHAPSVLGSDQSQDPVVSMARFLPGSIYQNLIREAEWLQENIMAVDTTRRCADAPRVDRAGCPER